MGLLLALGAMGTRFELIIADEANDADMADLRAAGEEALSIIQDWHDRLSAFDAGSIVSRINACAGREAVRVDRDMLDLLLACASWHAESGGAFDIALGSLMAHHGFRAEKASRDDLPAFGMGHLAIDESRHAVMLTHPDVRLDLGAVAKGWAIDEACEALIGAGVRSALLHGGTSTARAIGTRPDAQAWRVRIADDTGAPCVLLRDSAMSVSAPAGRMNASGEGHVLDPRTGEPSQSAEMACAASASAAASDAWSTALLVSGARPGSMPGEIASILRVREAWVTGGERADEVFRVPTETKGAKRDGEQA